MSVCPTCTAGPVLAGLDDPAAQASALVGAKAAALARANAAGLPVLDGFVITTNTSVSGPESVPEGVPNSWEELSVNGVDRGRDDVRIRRRVRRQLVALGDQCAELFGGPQDVKWCVSARWHGSRESAPRMSRALSTVCVTETSGRAKPQDFEWSGRGTSKFVVAPSLGEADRRQLEGCLSDLRMPKLIVSVQRMRSVVPGNVDD